MRSHVYAGVENMKGGPLDVFANLCLTLWHLRKSPLTGRSKIPVPPPTENVSITSSSNAASFGAVNVRGSSSALTREASREESNE